MAISLKEQLAQSLQLNEVSYHAPIFDTNYYNKAHDSNHDEGQKAGRRMFYDFYAMEFLWAFLGSGQIPKAEREKLIGLPLDDPKRDIIQNKGHRFLPHAAVKTIDSMYEQVTNTVAKNLLAYVRLAVVQEFQYLVSASSGWRKFRQELLSKYNSKKSINKSEFDALVDTHIPAMKPYPDTIKRLLKFSKYFSEMHTVDDKDPFDVSRGIVGTSSKKNNEPEEFPNGQSAEEPKSSEDPDDTDYNAEPASREFGKYGGAGQPSHPDDQETWSGAAAFKDAGDLPKIPADDDDDDDGEPAVKEILTEEYINPEKVRKVYAAINKAGITLDDIEKAYNKVPWGGAYGGPRWGAGAVALLKLAHAKKNLSTEDMNHIIDHIYDLQHNTGSLLNKGPMFIKDSDLNRRYKISNVARFIPFVSPIVQNMILRYQRYLHGDPAQADLEAKMENLQKSPKLPLDAEEINKLTPLGFKHAGGNSYRVGINFTNKKGDAVGGVYYEIAKHEVGTWNNSVDPTTKVQKQEFVKAPDSASMYVVSDNLKADVKAFPTFDEAFKYVNGFKHEMNPHSSIGNVEATPAVESAKHKYINARTKMKLPPMKEQMLLNIQFGWRKKGQYYKAYFPSNRLLFYAFTDGSFLISFDNSLTYNVTSNFPEALTSATAVAAGAQPYPEKDKAQAEINIALGKPPTSVSPATPKAPSAPSAPKAPSSFPATLKQLPPNSTSKAAYSLHVGIQSPPKHTLRLTKEDEDGLKAIGFEPFMVGEDVWYKHKFAGDTVKFFPNNTAKVLFTSGGINKAPSINGTVDKILVWLPTKYNSNTIKSPIQTGASTSPLSTTPPPTSGIKGGTMFEKTISDAGFFWQEAQQEYVDYVGQTQAGNQTANILKIAPNRSSVITFASGEQKQFKDLASLVAYLKKDYPTQKKSLTPEPNSASDKNKLHAELIHLGYKVIESLSDGGLVYEHSGYKISLHPDGGSVITSSTGHIVKTFETFIGLYNYLHFSGISVYPSTTPEKLLELLNKGEYKYVGPSKSAGIDSGYTYLNAMGDEVILYIDLSSKVKDSKSPGYQEPYETVAELITYLQEKFGSVPAATPAQSQNPHQIMADLDSIMSAGGFYEPNSKNIKVHDKIGAIKALREYGSNQLHKKTGLANSKWAIENFPLFMSYVERNGFPPMEANEDDTASIVTNWSNGIKNPSGLTPSGSSNIMSQAEENELQNIADELGLKFKKGYLTESSSGKPQVQYVSFLDQSGKPLFAATKKNGKYVVYQVSRKQWFKVYEDESFLNLKVHLYDILKDQIKTSASKVGSHVPSNGPVGPPQLLPDSYHYVLATAGFVQGTDNKGQVSYNHNHDFLFRIWGTAIQWSTEKGMKEYTFQNGMDEFLKVLNSVYPNMNGDKVDELFTKQTLSKEDQTLETLIEKASRLNGVGGYMVMGAEFEHNMDVLGFEWLDASGLYYNEDIKQLLVLKTDDDDTLEYNVFYINSKGKGMHYVTDGKSIFQVIGPDGSLENFKKADSKRPSMLDPSGALYKTHSNAANQKLVELNSHDAKLMELCGFKFTPSENKYYKNSAGDIFQFLDTGKTEFYDAANSESVEFDTVPKALTFAVSKYISQTNPTVHHPVGQWQKLPPHKEAELAKRGFIWVDHMKTYVKNLGNPDEQEKVIVTPNTIQYYYEDENETTKVFESENLNAILNKIFAVTFNKSIHTLTKMGYVQVSNPPMAPLPPNMGISNEFYKDKTKEILQIFSNGTARYGAFSGKDYVPYVSFDSLEEAVKYLGSYYESNPDKPPINENLYKEMMQSFLE